MIPSQTQYLVDGKGDKVAVLVGIEDYRRMKGMAEQFEAMRRYADTDEVTTTVVPSISGRGDDELEALGVRSFP